MRDHSLTDHSTLKEPTNLQLGKDSSVHLRRRPFNPKIPEISVGTLHGTDYFGFVRAQ